MWYLLGFSVILLGLFLYGQYRKQKKYSLQKEEVDGVLVGLINNHPQINYSVDDTISYFGSITYDEDIYADFKSLSLISNKELNNYFSKQPYNEGTDNLLVYKITKKGSGVSYLAIILDPVDMQQSFSLHEVLGPYNK